MHLSVVLLVLSIYLGLAYLTRLTQGFYLYEWLNPAHGSVSIVLHVLGYAGGMVVITVIVRYAIVGRNMLAEKMDTARLNGSHEKGLRLDTPSDTWSSRVELEKPQQVANSLWYVSRV